jgi:ADP-ribose pyrophosphatase
VGEWTKLGEERVYEGFRTVMGRRYRTPDAVERLFEIKLEPDTAVVLAMTPARDVVLVREFRPGPERSFLELPGGVVDEGEEPAHAARRELLEETGYGGELASAGSMLDCAYSTRTRHVFLATNCRRVAEPTPQGGEFPEVVLMSLMDFRDHLRSGQLTDVGPGYIALDALNLL